MRKSVFLLLAFLALSIVGAMVVSLPQQQAVCEPWQPLRAGGDICIARVVGTDTSDAKMYLRDSQGVREATSGRYMLESGIPVMKSGSTVEQFDSVHTLEDGRTVEFYLDDFLGHGTQVYVIENDGLQGFKSLPQGKYRLEGGLEFTVTPYGVDGTYATQFKPPQ